MVTVLVLLVWKKQHSIAVDYVEPSTAVAAAEPLVATALLPAGEAFVAKG